MVEMWFLGIYQSPGIGITSSSLYRSEESLKRHNEFRADRLLKIVSAEIRSGINAACKEAMKELRLHRYGRRDLSEAVETSLQLPDARG
jgi:hypothetical protein